MKQGVMRLLVPKSTVWRGMSKRFSVLYNGKWLKNADGSNSLLPVNFPSSSATTTIPDKFHCLSREDVIRFLIGWLGALAPLPLSSISSLEAINPNYCFVEATCPAVDAPQKHPLDPCAIAVVETIPNDQHKIIGEISACKLWKCDYLAAGWALANLSAGQFVMGAEDTDSSVSLPNFSFGAMAGNTTSANGGGSNRPRRFSSSRSVGFYSNSANPTCGVGRSMYRGRSSPLTCRETSSMAAVMAQMLSHRATHVWVTEADNDDTLVGVVSYVDILGAVTRQPSSSRDA
ncbi:kinase modulator [Lithospermum erythrorhizon]|uniref:Kinase modulator n=1 Tax=Lithospermum erythrorhizon TaxID=34254 RepID=A0AAV3RX70_LITER